MWWLKSCPRNLFLYADGLWKIGCLEVETSIIKAVHIPLEDVEGGLHSFEDYVDDPGSEKSASSSERNRLVALRGRFVKFRQHTRGHSIFFYSLSGIHDQRTD